MQAYSIVALVLVGLTIIVNTMAVSLGRSASTWKDEDVAIVVMLQTFILIVAEVGLCLSVAR